MLLLMLMLGKGAASATALIISCAISGNEHGKMPDPAVAIDEREESGNVGANMKSPKSIPSDVKVD